MKPPSVFIGILLVAIQAPAFSATLNVAAAASTQDALNQAAKRFEQETKHRVQITYGSSGKLTTQITQGAPFDLFFSADNEYPAKLHKLGIVETPKRYGRGRLMLWVLKESPLDITKGLGTLKDVRIQKVAIANPDIAPYGRAAVEALKAANLYQSVEGKFVRGENISQAAQFADTGSADIGFISLSLALSPRLEPRGKAWKVPQNLHSPIDQDVAVIKTSKEKEVAEEFLDYCTSSKTRDIWQRYGFE